MAKKTEAQLIKILNDARNQLREIEDKRIIKERRQYVGKCFKFRNSYGSGESWWLYCKALHLDGTSVIFFQFQKDSNGRWEIVDRQSHYLSPEYVEIPCHEFQTEWLKCLEELNGLDVL